MVLISCGGNAASIDAGTNDLDGGDESTAQPPVKLEGCPDPEMTGSCPGPLLVNIDFRASSSPINGVWAEPLQVPPGYDDPVVVPTPPGPDQWDRSALPAGACVLRIHGLPAGCTNLGATLTWEKCDALPPEGAIIEKVSYYETTRCSQGIAPGCAGPSRWDSSTFWWYLVPRKPDLDLVICAPMCAEAVGATSASPQSPRFDGCLTVYR